MGRKRSSGTGNTYTEGFEYYITGLNAVIEGQTEHAINLLSRAVELDSDISDAYYHLGRLFINKGEIIRGQKLFRDLLLRRDITKDFRSKVEDTLVKAYILNEEFHQAQELAEYRVSKYPYDIQARLTLTFTLERQNNYEAARKHWQAYARLSKISPKPRLALYKVELARTRPSLNRAASQSLLRQALKLDPKCAPAYILIARQYRKEGKERKVLKTWKDFLEQVPEKSTWIFNEMEEYLNELNLCQEIPGIYQALYRKEGPHQTAARLALARQYYKTGKKELAQETVLKMQEGISNKESASKELIRYYLEVNKNESALKKNHNLLTDSVYLKGFICKECRAESKEAEWHCPECGAWESYL